MKLNKTTKKQAGLTLIEITLVIAVLLGLISVLFIGVSAYKEGSNRSKCILTISNVQKAVRSYQNLYEIDNGEAMAYATLIGSGKMLEVLPVCGSVDSDNAPDPATSWSAAGYASTELVPTIGNTFITCIEATNLQHAPNSTTGW